MEFKIASVEQMLIDERTVKGFPAISGNVDSGFDRLFLGAFKKTLKERGSRVAHLWGHDYSSPPIAAIVELKEVKRDELPESVLKKAPDATGGLMLIRKYLETPRAEEVLQGIKAGVVTEMSFGYEPVKFDFEEDADTKTMIRNLREVRLWDTSDVIWGMNSATVAVAKHVIPFLTTGAVKDEKWEAPTLSAFSSEEWADLEEEKKMRIAEHFAYASDPILSYSDLKYCHHYPQASSLGKASLTAVKLALRELMKDTDISDEAHFAVYSHLSKHMAEMSILPPSYNDLLLVRSALLFDSSLKEGRVLSQRNLDRLKTALDTLVEILYDAEPADQEEDDQKRLFTSQMTLQRIRLSELDLFNL